MNSNYSFIKPKFKNDIAILNADIASLKFALDLNNRDDIVSDFLKFHHSATKNIRNSKINLLDSIPHEKFKMIIYKWGMLYEKYYKFLQKKHPPNELQHFHPELKLSISGIAAISIASRYSEFWAESAVRNINIYNQWEERLDFIGSDYFYNLHRLRENGDFLAYDRRKLSLPVFDLHKELTFHKEHSIWDIFKSNNWHLVRLSNNAIDFINNNYNKRITNFGEIKAIAHCLQRSKNIFGINFTTKSYGSIGLGYAIKRFSSMTYFLDSMEYINSFNIMQHLRHASEFCSIVFHKDNRDEAFSIFPNQSPVDVTNDISLEVIIEISKIDGIIRNKNDYLCLDEWYFNGNDYSYRKSRPNQP